MTMVYCAALNCHNGTNGAYRKGSISFYSFPLGNEALLRQWVRNMGRDMETPSKYQRLCSEHFEESSFERDPLRLRKWRRLRKEAVPRKFILGDDGTWLVGTPQRGFCDRMGSKTRKRIQNPVPNPVPNPVQELERFRASETFPKWPRLEDWQNEFYKLLLKEKYGSLIVLGRGRPVPKSCVPAGGASRVKDPQDLEEKKIPATLGTGRGGARTRSQPQAAGGTEPHGPSPGSGTSGSRHNPAANPTGSGSGVPTDRELDEFRKFLLYHQGQPEAAAAAPWFICAACGKSFARHANLVRHQRTHVCAQPHACSECGRRFLGKPGLSSHLKTHFRIVRVPEALLG